MPRCVRAGGSVAAARATRAADLDRDLTRDEVNALVDSSTLDELCALAAETRARGPNPRLVTFSPKVFVPLTRACRDACGYCTFASDPTDTDRVYMTLDEVLDVAERGRRAGATECLFTLGDRPEARYPAARDELRAMGHASTVDYLAHCAGEVLRRVGLLPHCNAGVLTREELAKLRKVSVSQGLMLESATDRLVDQPDAAHEGCESKRPAARLRTTTLAGELRVPFTSGVLIGIGETREERIDALFAIRDADRACAADRGAATGRVHEIIVQNFRAKSDTRMRDHPEPTLEELLWTAATARLIFGPHAVVQVPPNLTPEPDDARVRRDDGEDGDFGDFGGREGWRRLLRAGVSDWGGISGRHPGPRLSRSAVAAPRRTGGGDSRGGVLARAQTGRAALVRRRRRAGRVGRRGGGATRQSRRGRRRALARVGMVPGTRGGGERGRGGGDDDENRGRARIDRGGVRRLETGPRGRLGRSSTLAARSSSASEKCDRRGRRDFGTAG